MMDCRVKPGNDAAAFATVPVLRSGMKNAAPRPGRECGVYSTNLTVSANPAREVR
jgi:hypothetical protein